MPPATSPPSVAPTGAPPEAHAAGVSAPEPAPPSRRPARLRSLDGLRFFAAAGVVLYHYAVRNSQAWGQPVAEVFPQLGRWVVYAALGPELFFVISGFVILMTAWDRTIANVAASRIARLFPAYWAGVLLTGTLLLWLWPEGKNVTPGQVAINLTMLQAPFGVGNVDGVYWTLWAELRFYLLMLAFVAIGVSRRRVLAFATLWPAAALVADAAGPAWLRTVLVAQYAPLFAAGMVLFVIRREGHSALRWALVVANAAAAVWLVVPDELAKQARNSDAAPSGLVIGLLVVAFVALVAVVTMTRAAHVQWRWLTTVGALTFPLYLLHEHWGWWLIWRLPNWLPPYVTLALAMTFALALAAAVHHAVERPVGPRLRAAVQAALEKVGDRRRGSGHPGSRAAGDRPAALDRPGAVLVRLCAAREQFRTKTGRRPAAGRPDRPVSRPAGRRPGPAAASRS